MTHFLGTHQNKLDAKGRVSIPAPFRQGLRVLDGSDPAAGVSMILRPSHTLPCIEAWPTTRFNEMLARLDGLDEYSEDYLIMATSLGGGALPHDSDKEGRIALADGLRDHAGIKENVAFMGIGKIFQIWEPAAAAKRYADASAAAAARKLSVPRRAD